MPVPNSTIRNVIDCFEVITNCTGSSMVIKVLDIHGRIAKTVKQSVQEGIEPLRLNVDDLRRGNYIINIFTDDNFIKTVRYTKN